MKNMDIQLHKRFILVGMLIFAVHFTLVSQEWNTERFWQGINSDNVIERLAQENISLHERTATDFTVLMAALARTANISIVQTLVEAGADINAANEYGYTALNIAATDIQTVQMIRSIIELGADLQVQNSRGDSPFTDTVKQVKNPELLLPFVEAGQNINVRSENGATPVMYASRDNDSASMLRMLMDLGADINAADEDGNTALWYAMHWHEENTENIRALVQAGARPQHRYESGESLLERVLHENYLVRQEIRATKLGPLKNSDDHSNYKNIVTFIQAARESIIEHEDLQDLVSRTQEQEFHPEIVSALSELAQNARVQN